MASHVVGSSSLLGEIPTGALNQAFDREARIGAVLVVGVQLLLTTIDAIRVLVTYMPMVGKAHFFDYVPAAAVSSLVLEVMFALIFIGAIRSKRPFVWCVLAFVFYILVLTEFRFYLPWHPSSAPVMPLFMAVRIQDHWAYVALIVMCALPLSRRFLIASGLSCMAVWLCGSLWTFHTWPGGKVYWGPFGRGIGEAGLRAIDSLETLAPDYLIMELLLFAAFTFFVIVATQQGRRLVVARVQTEAALDFLSRFFPPAIAERISRTGQVSPARRQAVVAFVDWSDGGADLDALRARFVGVEKLAFVHDGTIDHFSGGPLMLSFGAVETDADAPRKAFECVLALRDGRNDLRCALHFGDTVAGEFGGTQTRIFSVVGDVVNTARRVLDVASEVGAAIVATEEALNALPLDQRPAGFKALPPRVLRGRETAVHLWGLA